jgi:DNA-binding winged helix-turn-helix (wHTH) protein
MDGKLVVDLDNEQISLGGRDVKFTKIQSAILCLLANPVGKVFTSDEIITGVWGYDYADSRNVAQRVFLIRSILGGGKDDYIITIPKMGYRLNNSNVTSNSNIPTPFTKIPSRIILTLQA